MADSKKYWYIQLNVNFFEDERIDWLCEQQNGYAYVVLYLKLCLKTANNNGILTRQIGDMIIPYNIDKIAETTHMDEVRAYCKERGNTIDAESFVDYYASTGWLVGKKPMKDWKASVRTWERNERRQDNARPDTAATGNTKREWHLECAVDGTKDYNREPSTGQIDWPELS